MLSLEIVFHFPVGNAYPVTYAALLHPAGQHFIADLLTGLLIGHPFFRQLAFEFGQGHTVAAGNIGQGFVQLVVADAHAHLVGHLQLQGFLNQLVQYPLLKQFPGRQTSALRTQATDNGIDTGVQLTLEDHLVIHDRNHTVQQFSFGLSSH